MGLGGDLMYTAIAREIKKAYPGKDILFKKSDFGKNRLQRWMDCFFKKDLDNNQSPVFLNNPYVVFKKGSAKTVVIDRGNPKNHYIEKILPDRYVFKDKQHIVNLVCQNYRVNPQSIQPQLFFNPAEEAHIQEKLKTIAENYIVVEPNGKIDFTENRLWFFERWQELVNRLDKKCKVIQVGDGSGRQLENVINFNGQLTYRETALLIKYAKLFIGTIGGLMHTARAVDTKSIILYSGYEAVQMAGYPENINIIKKVDCSPCGLTIPCPFHRKCMDLISVDEVRQTILEQLQLYQNPDSD